MRALVLVLFLAPAGEGKLPSLPVELRVIQGRAVLLEGTEVVSHSSARGPRAIEGPVQFEIGPGSQAEILWRGRMSLRVSGPAALHVPDSSTRPLETRVEILFAAGVELEVRRGAMRAQLSDLGELEVKRSAVALGELSQGGWEILHRGGDPVRFSASGATDAQEIRSGTRARIEAHGL